MVLMYNNRSRQVRAVSNNRDDPDQTRCSLDIVKNYHGAAVDSLRSEFTFDVGV